jgi:hypothetical protein
VCVKKRTNKGKKCKLMLAGFDNATAFVSELAILQARGRGVRSFPFCAAAGAGGFVFVAPYFEFAATDMAVNVSGFGL